MSNPFIQIKELRKEYFAKGKLVKAALQGVSLELYEGEILGLLGVNGAGKTTLSSIIASLHPPTVGDVLWKGRSIYEDIISYRSIVGFCPQKPNIERTLTLEENLLFSGRCYGMSQEEVKKRKDSLMQHFDLIPYAHSSVDVLSGGYKQRFLIARTLMHYPKLVILDEPTVGLDPHIRHQMWKLIRSLKEEKVTVLLTTHYLDEAEELSDRVCIIDQGKILQMATPHELKTKYQKNKLEDVFLQLIEEEDQNVPR